MKTQQILLTALLFVSCTLLYAQTNTFPSFGNVGIGIENPQETLHVNGSFGLGTFSVSGTNTPGFKIEYEDAGTSTTVFKHNRWGSNIFFKRNSSSGEKNQLYLGGQNHRLDLFNDNNEVSVRLATNGTTFFNGGNLFVGNGVSQNGQRREVRVYGYDNHAQFYGSMHSNYDDNKRTFDISTNSNTSQLKIDASAKSDANIVILPGVNGNVGIGTTNPSHLNHVSGRLNSGRLPLARYENVGNSNAQIDIFGDAHPNRAGWVQFGGWNSDVNMAIVADSKANVENGLSTKGIFLKGHSGNVGIGTTNPGAYKLAVEGRIGAREVEVKNGSWADFVFKDGYQLPTLEAVEQHIKTKGYLQDMPSEEEVLAKGTNLGDMDAKLLQKIEELMLYTIEQEKRIKALETKLER